MLTTIFHNNEIWDQFTDPEESRQTKEDIPLYALAYKENTNTWWCWYHSWNYIHENQPRKHLNRFIQLHYF